MKQIKIALVIKTEGLEYDDRVRKEILTVQRLFPNVSFFIYVMLPVNCEKEGETSYGVKYKSVFIPSRDKYASGEKAFLKAWQFYRVIEHELRGYDAVWASNDDTVFIPLLTQNKNILWDLHEIPASLTSGFFKRWILRLIFKRCKIVLHANPQRINYLKGIGVIKDPSKHFALRNYPNFEDCDSEYDEKYYDFLKWKDGRRCVYLQGIDGDLRADYESISAVLNNDALVAVVVGGFNPKTYERLKLEYGGSFLNRIYFVGKIPQLKIPQYVRECCLTMVFYKNSTPNNYLCEANRFYQAIILGLPVIAGNNPSLKELIDRYEFGVSIDSDGSDINMIIEGLNKVLDNYDLYKNNVSKDGNLLTWKSQDGIIRQIVDLLFK